MHLTVARMLQARTLTAALTAIFAICSIVGMNGCGNSTSSTTSNTSPYPAAYKQAMWSSSTTVSYPSDCELTYTTTGVPAYGVAAYYLVPTTNDADAVAETPITHMELALAAFSSTGATASTVTINDCPEKASSTTATNMGVIGYTLSGGAMFNPYEAGTDPPPALTDNASYTFTVDGQTQTASFIDTCNGHTAPNMDGGYTFHYHGVPTCITSVIDTSTGPSHLLGFALDGFPIYGGRDINGNVIDVSQLDTCNGITSATPELPNGAYHYVLPIGVTGKQSSINCYAGTVTESQLAQVKRLMCNMKAMRMKKMSGM